MVHFNNTNNTFNINVDRNNASNILFTKSDYIKIATTGPDLPYGLKSCRRVLLVWFAHLNNFEIERGWRFFEGIYVDDYATQDIVTYNC